MNDIIDALELFRDFSDVTDARLSRLDYEIEYVAELTENEKLLAKSVLTMLQRFVVDKTELGFGEYVLRSHAEDIIQKNAEVIERHFHEDYFYDVIEELTAVYNDKRALKAELRDALKLAIQEFEIAGRELSECSDYIITEYLD